MNRMEALAKHLGIELDLEAGETLEDYITEDSYTDNEFEAEGKSFLVLTDEEADEATAEDIADRLWAFNADFLAGHTGLPSEVFEAMQDKCEDANDTFRTLVDKCGDFSRLVSDAIGADGRGHFLSRYDGNEEEEGDYFIYRTN